MKLEAMSIVFWVGILFGLVIAFFIRLVESRVRRMHAKPNRALVESERMFRSLAEVLPIGIFRTDAKGECSFVNPFFCEVAGFDMTVAKGHGWRNAVHPEDREALFGKWAQLLEHGHCFSHEYRMLRVDGAVTWVLGQAQQHQQDSVLMDVIHVCSLTDISAAKAAVREIQQLAFFDPLTGLPNRRLFLDRIKQAVTSSTRSKKNGALLLLDLDNFKILNDTMGHEVGDTLLKQVSDRLCSNLREGDTVARLGGDEFVMVIQNLSPIIESAVHQAEMISEKILLSLNEPYLLADMLYHNTPSIGLTLFGPSHLEVDELMKRADMAMYQAKASGRNAVRFYDSQMQALVAARASLENDLRHALTMAQFELHYQPQLDASGKVTGAEAFVRWQSPSRGKVSPASFIPLAEETGLIVPLGYWVLQTACQQLALWGRLSETSHLSMAVKISAQQFRQPDFVEQVLGVLGMTGANPKQLKLELNESLLMVNVEDIIRKTTELTVPGIGFSLADLGTGYSSLSHLKRLSLEQLRIDQSFVQGFLTEPNDAAVTRSIFALANTLGLKVSAEGVETQEQHDTLAAFGCTAYQGYFFSQPLPVDEFEALVKTSFVFPSPNAYRHDSSLQVGN